LKITLTVFHIVNLRLAAIIFGQTWCLQTGHGHKQ
jgi:hypothetical protein